MSEDLARIGIELDPTGVVGGVATIDHSLDGLEKSVEELGGKVDGLAVRISAVGDALPQSSAASVQLDALTKKSAEAGSALQGTAISAAALAEPVRDIQKASADAADSLSSVTDDATVVDRWLSTLSDTTDGVVSGLESVGEAADAAAEPVSGLSEAASKASDALTQMSQSETPQWLDDMKVAAEDAQQSLERIRSNKLDDVGDGAEKAGRALEIARHVMGKFASEGGRGAAEMAGLNEHLSIMAGRLTKLALGNPLMMAAIAGVTALTLVWKKAKEQEEELRKAQDEVLNRAISAGQQARDSTRAGQRAQGTEIGQIRDQRLEDYNKAVRDAIERENFARQATAARTGVFAAPATERDVADVGSVKKAQEALQQATLAANEFKAAVELGVKTTVESLELEAQSFGLTARQAEHLKDVAQGLTQGQQDRLDAARALLEAAQDRQQITQLRVAAESLGKTDTEAQRLALTYQRDLTPAVRRATEAYIDAQERFRTSQLAKTVEVESAAMRMSAEDAEVYRLQLQTLSQADRDLQEQLIHNRYAWERERDAMERNRTELQNLIQQRQSEARSRRTNVLMGVTELEDENKALMRRNRLVHEYGVELGNLKADISDQQAEWFKSHPGARPEEIQKAFDLIARNASMRAFMQKSQQMAEEWASLWKTAVGDTADLLGTFMQGTDQNLDDFEEFTKAILRLWLNMLAQLASSKISSGVSSFIEELFNIGVHAAAGTVTSGASGETGGVTTGGGGGDVHPVAPNMQEISTPESIAPNNEVVSTAEGQRASAGVPVTLHQHNEFNYSALDNRGMRELLKEHKDVILDVTVKGVRESKIFARQLQGRD